MTVDELKDWMQDKFTGLENRLDDMNGKVTSHDRWLWLLRGIGTMILILLGAIGIKVSLK